ncbi:MAG: YciI family protein [Dehalococcoidia bacterium]|nr:YciI family protein [Chloroflexota bacterium]
MRYLMLIYADEKTMAGVSQEDMKGVLDAWFKYTDDFQKSGKMLGGEALQPTPTATTVRYANGKTVTSDGPFAETKEQLGGYYAIDATDLDEAIEWASKMPIPVGSVEIRPIMEFN